MNMKKLVLLILTLSFISASYGQDVYFGYKFSHLKMNNFSERRVEGLQLDIVFPDNHLGIHYEILWGKRYFHMPAAPIGGAFLGFGIAGLSDSSKGKVAGVLIGLLLAAIPEGVSYNVEVHEMFEFAPYISPLQYVDINDKGREYASAMAGSLGVRLNFYSANRIFRFSPFIEGQLLYKKGDYSGTSFGATASLRLVAD